MITPKGDLNALTSAYVEARKRFTDAILEYMDWYFKTYYPNVPLYKLLPQNGNLDESKIVVNGCFDWEGFPEFTANFYYYLPEPDEKGRNSKFVDFAWGEEFGFQIK